MSDFIKTNKSFRFNVDVIKAEGDVKKEFYVEGYASTPGLDRQGDIILSEALKDAAKRLVNVNNTVFFGHTYDLTNSVGKISDAKVDDYGLKVKIYVSKWAEELRMKLHEGIINKFSIGGRVLQDRDVPREEAIEQGLMKESDPFPAIKIIEKMELFEVSFVGVPANPEAHVVETFAKALHSIYKNTNDDMSDVKGGADMKDIEKDLEKDQKPIEDLESKETVEETKKDEAPEIEKDETVSEDTPVAEPSKESGEEPVEEITLKSVMYVCPSCGWKGEEAELADGKCPECGEEVKVLEEEKAEEPEATKEVEETPEASTEEIAEPVETSKDVEETPKEEVKDVETSTEKAEEPKEEAPEAVEVKDNDEISVEDIKELVDDEDEDGEEEDEKKPYYYFDSKEVKAELVKLCERLDKVEEALKILEEIKSILQEKVKTVEVRPGKASGVKKDENVERENIDIKKDPDVEFFKYITGN